MARLLRCDPPHFGGLRRGLPDGAPDPWRRRLHPARERPQRVSTQEVRRRSRELRDPGLDAASPETARNARASKRLVRVARRLEFRPLVDPLRGVACTARALPPGSTAKPALGHLMASHPEAGSLHGTRPGRCGVVGRRWGRGGAVRDRARPRERPIRGPRWTPLPDAPHEGLSGIASVDVSHGNLPPSTRLGSDAAPGTPPCPPGETTLPPGIPPFPPDPTLPPIPPAPGGRRAGGVESYIAKSGNPRADGAPAQPSPAPAPPKPPAGAGALDRRRTHGPTTASPPRAVDRHRTVAPLSPPRGTLQNRRMSAFMIAPLRRP